LSFSSVMALTPTSKEASGVRQNRHRTN